ncbi:BTB/POZ domain-containing protein 2-like protein, partial [Aphelenchoides avenae]
RRCLSCPARPSNRCFSVLREFASRRLEAHERSFDRGLSTGWIYSDHAIVRPSTFIAVLLAAERFGMQDLVSRLVVLAEQLLAVKKSFFYKILDVLEHRQIGCANELAENCLEYFDKNAAAFTKRPSFLSIGHERLMKILARDSLCLREIDVYRTATKWARVQLKRANKRRTRRAMREVLGDVLFLIRFPTMHPQEFTNGPAKDNILSAKEKLAIYGRFYNTGPTSASNAFSTEPRKGTSTLPLRDFTPTYCQKCGARMSGDICPECGCSYHSSVECDGCGTPLFVGVKAFDITYCSDELDEDCPGVAYRCSCGAPNATKEWGRCKCRRCGLNTWRCVEDGSVKERTCKCYECTYTCPEDYSDGELMFSEDSSDDAGDDEEGEDGDDEQ